MLCVFSHSFYNNFIFRLFNTIIRFSILKLLPNYWLKNLTFTDTFDLILYNRRFLFHGMMNSDLLVCKLCVSEVHDLYNGSCDWVMNTNGQG